jgi:hypothetical protein
MLRKQKHVTGGDEGAHKGRMWTGGEKEGPTAQRKGSQERTFRAYIQEIRATHKAREHGEKGGS